MPDFDCVLKDTNDNDQIDELLNDYLRRRVLVFNDQVDDFVLEDYILAILKWNREDEYVPVEKRKPIRLYINSPGGVVISSHMLIDVIVQSKTPVIGVAWSFVASASFHIFLACHERVGFVSSVFLSHDGEVSISNSAKKAKETMNFFDGLDKRTKDFVVSRTHMTPEFYDEIYDMEYYMDIYKAKELGVIHKIVGEDCDLSYIW